jgi:site-specific DNA recombinase
VAPSAKRAALYKRVSSQAQVRDGYSLEFQEEIMRAYCERDGLTVVEVYEDGGRTGSNTQREGLQRLVHDAKARKFDLVLIFRVDRFSREPLDLLYLVHQLNLLGIALKSVTEAVDASDPAGELMLTILGAIGKFVRANIIQNAMLGKKKRAQYGRYTGGGVPFGYAVAEDGRYKPDARVWWEGKTASEVIPMIFDLFLRLKEGEGRGLRVVARWLNDRGVPAPKAGHGKWGSVSVRQILRNPVYTGDFVYAKTKQPMHGNQLPRPRDEWIVAPGSHEPLVPRLTWDRVQVALDDGRTGGGPAKGEPEELLTGFLRCSLCGSTLVPRRTSGKYRYLYYTCGSRYNENRRRDHKVCAFPYIRAEDLEHLVWRLVTAIASDEASVERVLSGVEEGGGESQVRELETRMAQAQKELERCDEEEGRLVDVAIQNLFRPEILQEKVARVRERRAAAARRLEGLREEWQRAVRARPYLLADAAQIRAYMAQLLAGGDLTVADRRSILGALVGYKGIAVGPDGTVEVGLRLPTSVLRGKLPDDFLAEPDSATKRNWRP